MENLRDSGVGGFPGGLPVGCDADGTGNSTDLAGPTIMRIVEVGFSLEALRPRFSTGLPLSTGTREEAGRSGGACEPPCVLPLAAQPAWLSIRER